mmetsp:Transcript_32011/g.77769  ORF Transcript_32011/g.77769 Transcript_32011/m.77769 type:complete len:86 (-) Transcript_32011:1513-1770(-)
MTEMRTIRKVFHIPLMPFSVCFKALHCWMLHEMVEMNPRSHRLHTVEQSCHILRKPTFHKNFSIRAPLGLLNKSMGLESLANDSA